MKVETTHLQGVLILSPRLFGDARGFFLESYSRKDFLLATGLDIDFVQDNHSRSVKGVLRGLHYQLPPYDQGKLVRCVRGAVYDVAVDIRRSSPTFGQWFGVELSETNQNQFWIPPGFAHGFITLTESADFLYKTTCYYQPSHDRGIAWNDPSVGIAWPDVGMPPQLSAKDQAARCLADVPMSDLFA